jgi:hypothetical protein
MISRWGFCALQAAHSERQRVGAALKANPWQEDTTQIRSMRAATST